jgi:hypothetical protein
MPDSFLERSEVLADMVGDGNLHGIFAVDGGARTVPLECSRQPPRSAKVAHGDT